MQVIKRGRSTPETKLRGRAQRLSAVALQTLESIMKGDGQDSVRLAAAREVLDRGHGRPKATGAEADDGGITVVVRRFTDESDDTEPGA